MKLHLTFMALAMSALFNVFFLAGYLRARAATGETAAADVIATELDLDASQSALFRELRARGREEAEVYENDIALVRQEMLDALRRDDGDLDRLQEIVDREAEVRRQWRRAEAGRFHDFVESLTPEQRRTLRARMERGMRHRQRHEAMLERFDANGDGVLDHDERQAAWEAMKERRRPHGWRGPRDGGNGDRRQGRLRAEIIRRFDADADGRLDAAEQDALLAWLTGP